MKLIEVEIDGSEIVGEMVLEENLTVVGLVAAIFEHCPEGTILEPRAYGFDVIQRDSVMTPALWGVVSDITWGELKVLGEEAYKDGVKEEELSDWLEKRLNRKLDMCWDFEPVWEAWHRERRKSK